MKGIPNVLKRSWPSPHSYRYCLRHIRANFQKEFKDSLHNLLWEAGCATDPDVYKAKRPELKVTVEQIIFPLMLEGRWVARLLFTYAVL